MRGTLALPMVLVSICCVGMVVESKTSNRDSDGYLHSGYAWPKTILWHTLRFSPGSLWFFYLFLAGSVLMYVEVLMYEVLKKLIGSSWVKSNAGDLSGSFGEKFLLGVGKQIDMDMLVSYQACALGSGLIYLSLGVVKLSDVMEAYLAGMVSVQVILSTPRVPGNKLARLFSMEAFILSSVFGIAMLDSYHPLNVLNGVYSVAASLITVILFLSEHSTPFMRALWDTILSVAQMLFSVIAFVLATRVEGTHRVPMFTILVTACVFTGIARSSVSAVTSGSDHRSEADSNPFQHNHSDTFQHNHL